MIVWSFSDPVKVAEKRTRLFPSTIMLAIVTPGFSSFIHDEYVAVGTCARQDFEPWAEVYEPFREIKRLSEQLSTKTTIDVDRWLRGQFFGKDKAYRQEQKLLNPKQLFNGKIKNSGPAKTRPTGAKNNRPRPRHSCR